MPGLTRSSVLCRDSALPGSGLLPDTDVSLEKRVDLAEKLEHRGHRPAGHSTDVLAATVRDAFLSGREKAISVESRLSGLDIPNAGDRDPHAGVARPVD